MHTVRHIHRALAIAGAITTIAAAALLPGQAGAQPAEQSGPIVIKFSHVTTADTPKGKGADRFKQLVEERSGGKVKVEVYPNSTLYKDKEEIEALQLGSVQMLAPALSKFGPLGVREFEVFDLPFIFPNAEVLTRVTEGPVGASLLKKLETRGITGLAYWDNGFKVMSANRPLREVKDMRGLKMRIQSSKVLEAQMRAVGALPQMLAFSEVYQALQTGVVDGTENTTSNYWTQKTSEVQSDMTVSDHGYIGYAVITNKKFWDGLPPDIRALLEQAMKDSTRYVNEIAQQENDEALKKIAASGKTRVITLTAAERESWRQAMLPVHKEMASRVGKDVIEAIYKEAQGAQAQR
ncbi:DctP family TRAP transporter solute-binding subunit [Azoarcus indigens]|uniref:C4-dicarboxylate-binding protein DctP n=1 Tax=Azoarcus indigens TaxID=29545 RepID=A0A4R6E623_9RHOO|nr:TRAP transporter substrate-binding protein [Azoarcus indigens]NMG68028.1 DctP family TRAP transporter solute-binding subunit [Azoarcus indigens]TDN53356.1 C4-dicarboxylate-binding protein DctP [Azoarcus indigens]